MAKKTKTDKKVEKAGKPDSIECEIEVGVIKELTDLILTLDSEVILNFHKDDGLSIQTTDKSFVMLGSVTIEKEAFFKYKINKKEIAIGLDLDSVKRFLMRQNKDEYVSMTLLPDEERLEMTIGNVSRKFMLTDTSLISTTSIPKLKFNHSMVIPGTDLQLSVKAVEQVSDTVEFQCDVKTLIIRGEDITSPLDNVEIPISDKKINLEKYNRKKMDKAQFPLKFVKSIIGFIRGKDVTLHITSENPIKIEWVNREFNRDQKSSEMRSVFYIAPRIMVE